MKKSKLFGYFIMFLGLGLLAYSFTGLSLSTLLQDRKMEKFEEETKPRSVSFENELQRYNQVIRLGDEGLVDPFNYKETDQEFHINDNNNLNKKALKNEDGEEFNLDRDAFGYLEVPAINLKRPIYLGATYDHLEWGLAHVDNTDLPIGGKSTRSVIAGHRGWAGDVMFYDLDQVGEGDLIFIHQGGKVLAYVVKESLIIDPSDWDSLEPVEGKDMLTLLTCDPPFPPFNERLIVNAYRVDKKDVEASKEKSESQKSSTKDSDKNKKDEKSKETSYNEENTEISNDDSDFYEVEKTKTKFTLINLISIAIAILVWVMIVLNIYRFIKEIKNINNHE